MKEAAEHSNGGEGIGEAIMHHITDNPSLELPFLGEIHLPTFHVLGFTIPVTKHIMMMWISTLLLLLIFFLSFRKRKDVPTGFGNFLEMLVLFVRDEIAQKNIGHGSEKYTSYLLTVFFFILTMNLLGLIPYAATATGNIGVTAALAGISFIVIQLAGILKYGVIKHFVHLVPSGIPKALLVIMIPVEILGMFAKPFALCIRLFANMTAGHVVILSLICVIFALKTIFVAPISIAFAIFIGLLEIFVAVLQAYIFTMLTALFIGMSAHPH